MSSIDKNDVNTENNNNKEYEQPDDTSGIIPNPLDNAPNIEEDSNVDTSIIPDAEPVLVDKPANDEVVDINNSETTSIPNVETVSLDNSHDNEDTSSMTSNPNTDKSGMTSISDTEPILVDEQNNVEEFNNVNTNGLEPIPLDNNAVGSELLKTLWENWWMIYIQLQKLSNDDVDLINKKKECIQAQFAFQSQYNIEKSPKSFEGGNKLSFTSMVMNPSKLFTKKIGGIKKRKTKKRKSV
jgi:hypothetical protein